MDVQYGAHSPVVLLLAWLFGPSVRGFLAYWLTLWLIFGLGIIALARQWKVPAWGGLLVALGLTFSGFFVGHAEAHPGPIFLGVDAFAALASRGRAGTERVGRGCSGGRDIWFVRPWRIPCDSFHQQRLP
jgi:hypothetical protein